MAAVQLEHPGPRPTAVPGAVTGPVAGFAGCVVLLGLLASTVGLGPAGWTAGTLCGATVFTALAGGLVGRGGGGLGPADRVTASRAVLVCGVAALVADAFLAPVPLRVLVGLATVALLLDAVDGWTARRTGTASTLGARFDMEVDALLILVLSVHVAASAGAWVLLIGAARYLLYLAGRLLPWLARPVGPRYWRKVVAAVQGIVLTAVTAAVLAPPVAAGVLALALALLAESFGRDVLSLHRSRHRALLMTQREGSGHDGPQAR